LSSEVSGVLSTTLEKPKVDLSYSSPHLLRYTPAEYGLNLTLFKMEICQPLCKIFNLLL
jgi:hypothetical protein